MASGALSFISVALKLILRALTCSYQSAPSTLPKSLIITQTFALLGGCAWKEAGPPLWEETILAKSCACLCSWPAASGGDTEGFHITSSGNSFRHFHYAGG